MLSGKKVQYKNMKRSGGGKGRGKPESEIDAAVLHRASRNKRSQNIYVTIPGAGLDGQYPALWSRKGFMPLAPLTVSPFKIVIFRYESVNYISGIFLPVLFYFQGRQRNMPQSL